MAGGMARHERLCPLILSLYGHPDAGGYWEKHCETHLGKVGFTPIFPPVSGVTGLNNINLRDSATQQ